jgi:carboxyl-terminal processing protease
LSRKLIVAALVAIAFVVGIVVGGQVGGVRHTVDDIFGHTTQDVTDQAIDIIHDDYFHTTDRSDLENASIEAMVDHIKQRYHDRFSHYFNPAEYHQFNQGAHLSGIGVAVTEVPQGLRVTTVYKRTPAREAMIQPGDLITAVNGKSIAGKSSDVTTNQIRGPAGTKVTLTIQSGKKGTPHDVSVIRREVSIPQVAGRIVNVHGHKVAFVRLAAFQPGVHGELREEVEKLYRRGAQGLVLDLRNNPGGLVTEAVLVSSIFIPDGPVITTRGRSQKSRTLDVTGDALPRRPMAVLINGNTASAAEVVTAALEQSGVAKVVGTTSFGKGVFEEVIPLKNGGALDLTEGEYLTRNGTSINGIGITPQVRVKDNPHTKQDETLNRALQVLSPQL